MALNSDQFFEHIDSFFDYRRSVYELSEETLRSNRIDLSLFRSFLKDHHIERIDGHAAIRFQYQLKKKRQNSGRSLNRKLFTLRSYSKYLMLKEVEDAQSLPFMQVPKVRSGYINCPHFLTLPQIKTLFDAIDQTTCLGIRNYAIYALMYGLGLRVGEVHRLTLEDLDLETPCSYPRKAIPLPFELWKIT
jgi:site-specific recombinase XerD